MSHTSHIKFLMILLKNLIIFSTCLLAAEKKERNENKMGKENPSLEWNIITKKYIKQSTKLQNRTGAQA